MSKLVKGLIKDQYSEAFRDVTDFMVVEAKGVNGNTNNEMRGVLKEKGIRMRVVKNSLMRNALESLDRAAAVSLFMAGPCAIVYGGDSVVDVAKDMAGWAKKVDGVNIKGAFVDGEALDAEGAKELSKMPSRAELQGTVVMLAQSPGRRVAGCLAGPGGIIAGCIKAIADKLEEAA